MATWHQQQADKRIGVRDFSHPTDWTIVIDPPHQMRALVNFSTKQLVDVYMRGLKENNPTAYAHTYILKPRNRR